MSVNKNCWQKTLLSLH